jgi:hypothetical protein
MDNQIIAAIIGGAVFVMAALIGLLPSCIKRRQVMRETTPLLKQQE